MAAKVDGRHSDTKERLFMIALDLFSEHGVEGTSIRDIVNKAGVSTAAFYNHFSSKDALLQAVYDYSQAASRPEGDGELAELLASLGPIDFIMRNMELFRKAMKDPVLSKLGRIIATEKGRNPIAAEISHKDCQRLIESSETLFEGIQGLGYMKGRDARLIGRMFGYMQLGLFDENAYLRYVKKWSVDRILERQKAQMKAFLEEFIGG